MTVSPDRPQDGNLQPKVGGSGVESNDPDRSTSIPPTLFKLPNLRANQADSLQRVAQTPVGSDHSGVPEMKVVDRGTNNTSVPQSWAQASHQDASHDTSSQVDTLPKLASQEPGVDPVSAGGARASAASPKVNPSLSRPASPEVPVGRSWMESLGSHGVVIVLLLGVVVAALLTGKGNDDPHATSLDSQSELLNFDELSADLPFPLPQGEMSSSKSVPELAAGSASVDTGSHSSDDLAAATNPATTSQTESSAPAPPDLESMFSTDLLASGSPTDPDTTSQGAITSLESPLPIQVRGPNTGADRIAPSGIQVNNFAAPSSGVNAMTVGNRVGSAVPTGATSPVRVSSQTPLGISDWSQYLPPLTR